MIKDKLSQSQCAQLQQLMRYRSVRPGDILDKTATKELLRLDLAKLENGHYTANWDAVKNWKD